MKIYELEQLNEFVKNHYDSNTVNNDNGGHGGGGGGDDDQWRTGDDDGNNYSNRLHDASFAATMSIRAPFELDSGIGDFTVNNTYRTFNEWRNAGMPIITSMGDSSRTEKYYIGFTDPRAMGYWRINRANNVSKEPNRMFVIDALQELVFRSALIDFSFYVDKFIDEKELKIYGDVMEVCTDRFIKLLNSRGFTSIIKLKDYL